LAGWVAGRPVLRVRISEDEPGEIGGLVFEVENTSQKTTSLSPAITSTFLYPERGRMRWGRAMYAVREEDRELAPFKARTLHASAQAHPPGYGHAWFRTFRFVPTRGFTARVRLSPDPTLDRARCGRVSAI
jgi:hypothetical protein